MDCVCFRYGRGTYPTPGCALPYTWAPGCALPYTRPRISPKYKGALTLHLAARYPTPGPRAARYPTPGCAFRPSPNTNLPYTGSGIVGSTYPAPRVEESACLPRTGRPKSKANLPYTHMDRKRQRQIDNKCDLPYTSMFLTRKK